MAAGDFTFFNTFRRDIGLEHHQLETDVVKLGLIDDSVTPTAADADPRWGSGGSTDHSATEVTPGGNYPAEGPTVANNTYTFSSGTATFDGDNVSIAQHASNPTDARWGILYNDTDSGKRAIGFLDLGAVINLTLGPFSVTWNASGIFTMT